MKTGAGRIACVGTRQLTDKQAVFCRFIGGVLAEQVCVVVSTGATSGADQAFAEGCLRAGGRVNLWLPWWSFEKAWTDRVAAEHPGRVFRASVSQTKKVNPEPVKAAYESLKLIPYYRNLTDAMKLLHVRNYLLTRNCWGMIALPGTAAQSGGTRQSMRIAKSLNIPVMDLYGRSEPSVDEVLEFLGGDLVKEAR